MAIRTHRFENGLHLLVEENPAMASAAMTLLLPAGVVHEPREKQGIGTVLSEMLFRGAADHDARQHADALDMLGVHRSAETGLYHLRIGAVFLGDRLPLVLPLLVDMVQKPHLNERDLGPSVQIAMQEIEALEDEPQDKAMIALKKQHLADPFCRSSMGTLEGLRNLTLDDVRKYASKQFVADGTILSFAGNVEFETVRDLVAEQMGQMNGAQESLAADCIANSAYRYHHIESETNQQHIGLAFETVGELHEDSVVQRLGVAVLSGGMSGRLFTEIREKRGLCYSVYATYAPRRESGSVYAYAGTTVQRAAETLEVMSEELRKLKAGVEPNEFARAVVGMKTRFVMQGESTSARARAIAFDQFIYGRPRSLEERAGEIDAVTLDRLNAFVNASSPKEFTTISVGPSPLLVQC